MPEITDYGILIADGKEHFLNKMRRILKIKKFSRIISALNDKQGIRILESAEEPFALIICDQNIPESGGSEFFKKTLDISPLSRRIILTEEMDFLSLVDAINHGGVHKYIAKTEQSDDLLKAIYSELKIYDGYARKKEFINLTKTQNRHLFRLAKQLKYKNKKFLDEIKKKQQEKQSLENALIKIEQEKQKKQDFPGLNSILIRNILIEPDTLLSAFKIIKSQAESCLIQVLEKNGIPFTFNNGAREQKQYNIQANDNNTQEFANKRIDIAKDEKYNHEKYEIIDLIIQFAVKKSEPLIRKIKSEGNRESYKKTKLDDFKTVPDIGELAYQEGYISAKELEDLKKEQEKSEQNNPPGRSIEKILVSSGLINRVELSRLMVKKRLIEIRLKDREFAKELIKRKVIPEERIEQAFTEQLNLFEKDSTCLSLGDILVRENAITPELRDELFRTHNRANEIPENTNISTLLSSKKGSLIDLQISPDRTKAYIRLPKSLHGGSDIRPIKDLLQNRGIRFGIVEDKLILGFMKYASDPEKKFTIAIGRYPEPGRDAQIKYYFNTKYQRPGIVSKDGTIDFKDRGDIPFVEKGALLAEKIPLKKGKPGIDIFGELIPVDDVKDFPLKGGTGTKSDESGLKLYSATEGQPSLNTAGIISVLKELSIKGNVDFETGHINFQGNVFVQGIVKEGFHVNCVDLTAGEIHGGIIKLSGNLNVSTGIINAKVRTSGNVKAKFINNSKIDALGDIIITREIMESDIAVSGECINEHGRITSSVIAAKKGFILGQVGTIKALPSTIKTGLDDYMLRLQAAFSMEIERKKAIIKKIKQKRKQLENQNFEMHKKVADHSFIQETLMKKITLLKERLIAAKSDRSEMIKIAEEIKNMENTIKESDEIIKNIFDSQDMIMQDIIKYEKRINADKDELEIIMLEKKAMEEIAEFEEPVPIVRINRKVLAGTKIIGPGSSMIIRNDLGPCKIMEIDSNDPSDKEGRQMIIRRL